MIIKYSPVHPRLLEEGPLWLRKICLIPGPISCPPSRSQTINRIPPSTPTRVVPPTSPESGLVQLYVSGLQNRSSYIAGFLNGSTCVMASWTVPPALWLSERFNLHYGLLNGSTYIMASWTVPPALWLPERFNLHYGLLNGSTDVITYWIVPPTLWLP